MAKLKIQEGDAETFGQRMSKFRNKAGYSQRDLAKETVISQRMIAYYEKQTRHPPTHLLPVLAEALGVSSDELLGIKQIPRGKKRICASGVVSARLNKWTQRKNGKFCNFLTHSLKKSS